MGSNSYGSARETFNIIVQGKRSCDLVLSPLVSLFFSVLVPPRILPRRRQIVTRNPVYVTCQASGRPDPVIRWIVNASWASGSSPSPADGFTVFSNGSIRIEPRGDATVSCTAENGIGKPATETIQILLQGELSKRESLVYVLITAQVSFSSTRSSPIAGATYH